MDLLSAVSMQFLIVEGWCTTFLCFAGILYGQKMLQWWWYWWCLLSAMCLCVFNCILKGVDSSAQSHAIACTDKEHKSSRQSRPARAVEQLSTDSDW